MSLLEDKLEEKISRLKHLKESKSGANCASIHYSKADVQREIEIEELEEEIKKIESQI